MEFFWDVLFRLFLFFLLLLLLLFLVSLVFISDQNFSSSSKDTAATTDVVELIIRTVSVSLLLTLAIAYYSRDLPVQ